MWIKSRADRRKPIFNTPLPKPKFKNYIFAPLLSYNNEYNLRMDYGLSTIWFEH